MTRTDLYTRVRTASTGLPNRVWIGGGLILAAAVMYWLGVFISVMAMQSSVASATGNLNAGLPLGPSPSVNFARPMLFVMVFSIAALGLLIWGLVVAVAGFIDYAKAK